MRLTELAERLQCSVGWLSQVERDISTPSQAVLEQISDVFEVPSSIFFEKGTVPDREKGRIVRAENRRAFGERVDGLVESLISPDLTDSFEMIHSVFQPETSRDEIVQRPTQELAYIVSGRLDVWIDGEAFTLGAGDSLRIRGEPFRWANPYKKPVVAIWVISPPVY